MTVKPTLVFYYLPGDQDDPDHPNAFPLSNFPEEIRLRDIKAKFPLPGNYHFRFKIKFENSFIWIDVTNDESTVPMYNAKIVTKVLRVNWTGGDPRRQSESSRAAGESTTPSSCRRSRGTAGSGVAQNGGSVGVADDRASSSQHGARHNQESGPSCGKRVPLSLSSSSPGAPASSGDASAGGHSAPSSYDLHFSSHTPTAAGQASSRSPPPSVSQRGEREITSSSRSMHSTPGGDVASASTSSSTAQPVDMLLFDTLPKTRGTTSIAKDSSAPSNDLDMLFG